MGEPNAPTLSLSALDLRDVLTNTLLAVSDDELLPDFQAVCLWVADGRLHAAATDRYRVCRDSAPVREARGGVLDAAAWIPASAARLIRRMVRKPTGLSVEVSISGEHPTRKLAVTASGQRLVVDEHASSRSPQLDKLDARLAGIEFAPAVSAAFRAGRLADLGRLVHNGRRLDTLVMAHRSATGQGNTLPPVRITSPARESLVIDLMPTRMDDGDTE